MIRIFKELCRAIFENPKEGFIIVKVLVGILAISVLGVLFILPQEFGKNLLDKYKPVVLKFKHEKDRDNRYTKT